jgi:energy-converting hydrogenase Eha subunit E
MNIRWFALTVVFLLPRTSDAVLVTHFNFNSYDGNASTINADSGSGVITLESGGAAWPAGELSNPAGTTLNAVGTDPAGTALALGSNGNGAIVRTLTVELATTGLSDLMLSFASAGSNATFNNAALTYSINGGAFVDPAISFDPASGGSFGTINQNLSGISALNGQSSVALRLTFSGTNLNGNQDLRIDNLQINATAVPETPAWALMLLAATLFVAVRGRWRIDRQTACAAVELQSA